MRGCEFAVGRVFVRACVGVSARVRACVFCLFVACLFVCLFVANILPAILDIFVMWE